MFPLASCESAGHSAESKSSTLPTDYLIVNSSGRGCGRARRDERGDRGRVLRHVLAEERARLLHEGAGAGVAHPRAHQPRHRHVEAAREDARR